MTAALTTQEKKRRAVLARGPIGSVGRVELANLEAAPKQNPEVQNIIRREERARLKAILSSRPYGDEQAEHLAYSTDISAEVACGILSIH
jgi:hypothetical protein